MLTLPLVYTRHTHKLVARYLTTVMRMYESECEGVDEESALLDVVGRRDITSWRS